MRVMKFGGSSVANAKNIGLMIDVVAKRKRSDEDLVVVVSALGGVTDRLIDLGKRAAGQQEWRSSFELLYLKHKQTLSELIQGESLEGLIASLDSVFGELSDKMEGIRLLGELSERSLDLILSFGERLSASMIGHAMNARGLECQYVDARQIIKTDSKFGEARVERHLTNEKIRTYFSECNGLFIMGGFIASNKEDITTTLGRGGSDYTASLVGAALEAEVIEIWTDVDGVMTADPRKVYHAFPLHSISYEEAGELAHFGAKVIHPKTMRPARQKNIPILIKNTFRPEAHGTMIRTAGNDGDHVICGVSSSRNVALIRIQSNFGKHIADIAARVFDLLSRHHMEVLLTTQASSEHAISIGLKTEIAKNAKEVIDEAFQLEILAGRMNPVYLQEDLSIVAIVGEQMKGVPGISGKLFDILGDYGINIVAIAQGSSELNISTVISTDDEERAINAIHDSFFQKGHRTAHLFLVGPGLVGKNLLDQVARSASYHLDELDVQLRLCGFMNSRKMVFSKKGMKADQWKELLDRGESADLHAFSETLIGMRLPQSIFVDCTASDAPVALYEKLLSHRIGIVAANKKANTGPYDFYRRLKTLSRQKTTPFYYETNVGAALPVIDTLQKIRQSGDQLVKIEAVLSGTLSYVFNAFAEREVTFSDIVLEAQNLGYTEPDPREDLKGNDAARKILLLSREAGLALEPEDVEVESILSAGCLEAGDVQAFYAELTEMNEIFTIRKREAAKRGAKLCMIARLVDGKASLSLDEIDRSHPFYSLRGSENIIAYFTERYGDSPLVVRGHGAGGDITASGVLADIIKSIP